MSKCYLTDVMLFVVLLPSDACCRAWIQPVCGLVWKKLNETILQFPRLTDRRGKKENSPKRVLKEVIWSYTLSAASC